MKKPSLFTAKPSAKVAQETREPKREEKKEAKMPPWLHKKAEAKEGHGKGKKC